MRRVLCVGKVGDREGSKTWGAFLIHKASGANMVLLPIN